ncbi:hypothetical protein HHK36_015258 [Tetracentron sinense]|uniref:LOB domain-containing protein n=1 Tax=Tetracentron sinense TaxID=13715 RepID=A0A835DGL1_TETSI|nr:hypothetical protein HHK36_015258 [Tetracentron sinense]
MGKACAACKYQRRKCSGECPLAPYFPADQPNMFENVHRLFGVSNALRVLTKLNQKEKEAAMRSVVDEANTCKKYPVHGCCGVMCQLHVQIQQTEEELYDVHALLAFSRNRLSRQECHCMLQSHQYLIDPD